MTDPNDHNENSDQDADGSVLPPSGSGEDPPMRPQPDSGAAIQFLQAWQEGGPWVLTSIAPDSGRTSTRTFHDGQEQKLRVWIDERQGRQNIYFSVNRLRWDVKKKAKKTDVSQVVALHVDVDPRPGEELGPERERALRMLREFTPPPTVIIDSGGGYQGFWVLREPIDVIGEDHMAELEAYNRQLEVFLGGDHCHNIDRIMRLPGTINVPGEKKRRKGRQEALATVVEMEPDRL